MGEQTDISDILTEMANSRAIAMTHRERIGTIMKHFAAKGIPLSICADDRHLARSVSTLKGYARDLRLRFPDYVPMELRTAEEMKRKKAAKRNHTESTTDE